MMAQLKVLNSPHPDAIEMEGLPVRMLETFRDKALGLLRSGKHSPAAALMRCSSVHTFGMKYPLDLAFIDRDGHVLRICQNVKPGDIRSKFGSWAVLERPASRRTWLRQGQRVWLMQEEKREGETIYG